MVNFTLEGKVAWVTGASYGIGFALASAFSEAGAKIVFNDISRELVDKGLAAYKELGIQKTVVVKSRGFNQEQGWTIYENLGFLQTKYGTTDEAVQTLMRIKEVQ